ncbi:hypothetical protein F2Q69_00022286 [Brassica cretica]|uniref:Uncharacterized protein n=1 Tax=Brassica cretica TaxID=69181 RepID=A0A8S9QGU6_BRACR|nr:hypothetical protein F2Q69_00022286 [Brassica cretica]
MYLQEPQYSDGDIAQKLLEHEVDKRSTFVLGLLALKVLILFFSPSATCIACYVNLTSSRHYFLMQVSDIVNQEIFVSDEIS